MDSSTTHGTSSASMIRVATVVFPDALPPHSFLLLKVGAAQP